MKLSSLLVAALLFPAMAVSAATLSSFDDFQSGNTTWKNGLATGIVSLGGGPSGMGDYYLGVASYGGGGAFSRMIIFNDNEWSGDYISAGIGQIEVDLANFGADDLWMRLAFKEPTGGGYASLDPLVLPADGVWRHFVFPLTPANFAAIGTLLTFEQSMGNVGQFRILSQGGGPPTSLNGDSLEGSLGIDNVQAAVPEPSAGWMVVGGAVLGAALSRRRAGFVRRR